jgi:hypothetical protein
VDAQTCPGILGRGDREQDAQGLRAGADEGVNDA